MLILISSIESTNLVETKTSSFYANQHIRFTSRVDRPKRNHHHFLKKIYSEKKCERRLERRKKERVPSIYCGVKRRRRRWKRRWKRRGRGGGEFTFFLVDGLNDTKLVPTLHLCFFELNHTLRLQFSINIVWIIIMLQLLVFQWSTFLGGHIKYGLGWVLMIHVMALKCSL